MKINPAQNRTPQMFKQAENPNVGALQNNSEYSNDRLFSNERKHENNINWQMMQLSNSRRRSNDKVTVGQLALAGSMGHIQSLKQYSNDVIVNSHDNALEELSKTLNAKRISQANNAGYRQKNFSQSHVDSKSKHIKKSGNDRNARVSTPITGFNLEHAQVSNHPTERRTNTMKIEQSMNPNFNATGSFK